jgi:TPR repeat protein
MSCPGNVVALDIKEGFKLYEIAATLGHAVAQYNLAIMLTKGQGCEINAVAALAWLEAAAEQDLPEAQFTLAGAYQLGTGVKQDLALARAWYERAAQSGHKEAISRLSTFVEKSAK